MKIRSGFVSNSSSSSFILPLATGENGEINLKFKIEDLLDLIENKYDVDDTGIDEVIRSVEELNDRFSDRYDLEGDFFENVNSPDYVPGERDYVEKEYLNSVKLLKDGNIIIMGGLSYNDTSLNYLLKKFGAIFYD